MNNLSFKLHTEDPESTLTEDEYDEAVKFGKSPTLIEAIKSDYSAIGLIGEGHNKLPAYLAAVSRKSDTPLNVRILNLQTAVGRALQSHNVEGPVSIFQTTTATETNAVTRPEPS